MLRLVAPLDLVVDAPTFAPELRDALAQLAPRERACLVLRHLEGMSTRETAEALGLSEGAVKRYLFDAKAALALTLGPLHNGDEHVPIHIRPREVRHVG